MFIKRDGNEYRMEFRDGFRCSPLETLGAVGKRNTGTRLRFWPDPKYFDTPKFAVKALRHLLRAKAVLCPGLTVKLFDEASGERNEWFFENGLPDYLQGELQRPRIAAAGAVHAATCPRKTKSSTGPWPGSPTATWCRKATST